LLPRITVVGAAQGNAPRNAQGNAKKREKSEKVGKRRKRRKRRKKSEKRRCNERKDTIPRPRGMRSTNSLGVG
jgi:hypothetical protein